MYYKKIALVAASALSVALVGCGGGASNPSQSPKVQFSSQVSFGDSLSDVGTYNVGTIKALSGGRYTVNSTVNGAPAKTNWTELLASQLGLTAPCPYQTGLNGSAAYGFSVPVVSNSSCTAYGQGGAMITNPYGPGNANNPLDGSVVLGQLTVPLVTQMQNHLSAHGGAYTGNEVVFILAGGNDAIYNYTYFAYQVQTASAQGAAAAQAMAATAGPAAVKAMGVAAGQLVSYINTYVTGKGAKYVVVLNVPDLSTTPFGVSVEKLIPGSQSLVKTMDSQYNATLQAGLASNANVLFVDVNSVSADQVANPAIYGLTNVTDTACNLAYPTNALATPTAQGSSLVCNGTNVISGDVSHYEFADSVHPTPYGNVLLARYVAAQMATKGWL